MVTKATALDDQGETLSLSGAALDSYSAALNAKELVDTTPPTYQGLAITPVNGGSRPYVYDNGVVGSMGRPADAAGPAVRFLEGGRSG